MSTITPYWWPRRRGFCAPDLAANDSGFTPTAGEPVETLGDTHPAPLDAGPRLRPGWENEPIEVPHPWRLYLLALLIGLLGFGLGGCGGGDDDEEPPRMPTPQTPCTPDPRACL